MKPKYLLIVLVILIFSQTIRAQQPTLTPVSTPSQEDIATEIRSLAADYASSDASWIDHRKDIMEYIKSIDTGHVLSDTEIEATYREEFERIKSREPSVLEQLGLTPSVILGAIGGAILAAFVFKFSDVIGNIINFVKESIYKHVAGLRVFKQWALRRYEDSLIDEYEKLKITFREKPLEMSSIYVPLKVRGQKDNQQIDAFDAIREHRRVMVTGDPGSGKSVLMRQIALTYAWDGLDIAPAIPVLIELYRLTDAALDIKEQIVKAFERHDFPKADRFVQRGLENGALLLLFDGFDEVSSADRVKVARTINDFAKIYDHCHIVTTCRTAVYRGEFDEIAERRLEIVEFSDQQIYQFMETWRADMPPGKSVEQLIRALQDRPRIMALARNPLLLTIIAYLYTDTDEANILPQSRAEFYRLATDELLRKRKEEMNHFGAPQKRAILENLALFNQESGQDEDRKSIDFKTVIEQVKQVLPRLNLKDDAVEPILNEIVERSGLLLAIDGGEKFQFAHLTLQEYFAASALLNQGDWLAEQFEGDPDIWRETVKLWCGMASDSTELIKRIYEWDTISGFECVGDALNIDATIGYGIVEEMKKRFLGGRDYGSGFMAAYDPSLIRAFSTVASDVRPRGVEVFDFIVNLLKDYNHYDIAMDVLSITNLPRAAQALAQFYEQPTMREALLRMGDLAVPELEKKISITPSEVIQDLYKIGTPQVGVIMLPLLFEEEFDMKGGMGISLPTPVAIQVAWTLANLLQKSPIEEVLRRYPLTGQQRKAPYLDYIWKPFEPYEPEGSALPVIAGRIAYLIEHAPPEGDDFTIDARIGVPLWALGLKRQTIGIQTGIDFPGKNDMIPLRDGLYSGNKLILEKIESFNKQLIIVNLIHGRLPNRNDWLKIFKRDDYDFGTSWHFRTVTAIYLIISLVAVIQMFSIVLSTSSLVSWYNLGLVAGIAGIAAVCYQLLRNVSERFNGILRDIWLGPLTVIRAAHEEFQKQKNTTNAQKFGNILGGVYLGFIASMMPLIFGFTIIALLYRLSPPIAVLISTSILAMCGALIYYGQGRERLATNPLRGIFEPPNANVSSVAWRRKRRRQRRNRGLLAGIWR